MSTVNILSIHKSTFFENNLIAKLSAAVYTKPSMGLPTFCNRQSLRAGIDRAIGLYETKHELTDEGSSTLN